MEFAEQSPDAAALAAVPRRWTTEQIILRFIDYLGAMNRSQRTVDTYKSTLVTYRDWLGATHIWDATPDDQQAFIQRTRLTPGHQIATVAKPATRAREVGTLRSFYGWAWEQGHTDDHLAKALHAPTVHQMNPKPIADAVWRQVWESDLTDGERVFLGVGYVAGLRRSELAELRTDQMGPTMIHDFIRKGGGDHTLPWGELLDIYVDMLPELIGGHQGANKLRLAVDHLRVRPGLLMPWSTEPNAQRLNERLTQVCAQVGVPNFTPHQLRHSAITNWLRAGVPLHLASKLANHKTPSTTMIYVKAGGAELREWRRRGKEQR